MPWDKLITSTKTSRIIPATSRSSDLATGEEICSDDNDDKSNNNNDNVVKGKNNVCNNKTNNCNKIYENGNVHLLGNSNNKLGPHVSRWSLSRFIEMKHNNQPIFRYRQAKFNTRKARRRVVFKNGDCNVVQGKVAQRKRKYLQDIFTTLVDAQWRWTLLVFVLNFILSWLVFAVLWYIIIIFHGDLEDHSNKNNTRTPCVEGVNSFTSLFLFSVETQHTIGYGAKHVTDECYEAIFVLCLQSIVGVMIQAFMVGIVFTKVSRPKKRTQTLLFSRNAVICQRDGELCLLFRVGDMRKSHIIEAHVRAQLIRKKITKEGEIIPFSQSELKVGGDGEEDRIFFIWPTTIIHKITPQSPLYELSASDMATEKFEIVVILEGVIESTGMTTQARSSYLPEEIMWGYRFSNLVDFNKVTGEYEVDYSEFNRTIQVETPVCSAKNLLRFSSAAQTSGAKVSSLPEFSFSVREKSTSESSLNAFGSMPP